MVKFASECQRVLNELVNGSLLDTLGEETRELSMRFGLHSGPVTAGVLRGMKQRFQLFGGTVNVASRMESNGVKGRIHVSQATADELVASGKGAWLEARQDKIYAKGIGEVQTYFCTPNVSTSSATSTQSSGSSVHYAVEDDAGADLGNLPHKIHKRLGSIVVDN